MKRLAYGQREVGHVLDQEIVLHAGTRNADRVAFLEGVLPDRVRRNLAGNDHQRDRIHVGGGNASDRIGDPRTARHQRHTDLVARPRIGVGRVHRRLLVPHQDVLEVVLLEYLVVDVQDRAARVAEDVAHVLFLQAADHDLGTSNRFTGTGRGRRRFGTVGGAVGGARQGVGLARRLGAQRPRGCFRRLGNGCLVVGKRSHQILSRSFWRLIGRRSIPAYGERCGEIAAEWAKIAQRINFRKFIVVAPGAGTVPAACYVLIRLPADSRGAAQAAPAWLLRRAQPDPWRPAQNYRNS
ncbi:hypothetical protein SBBP1_80011 [Burkholderiales bacterium]|nr:hypothetical protein SBBP1_80011 [Burkholderiales bacterium]